MKGFLRVLGVGVLGFISLTVYFFFLCTADWCTPFSMGKIRLVKDFISCKKMGFPGEGSSPRRCVAGIKTYWEDEDASLRIMSPTSGERIGLPLVIRGEVLGGSGTIRYVVTDGEGGELVEDRIVVERAASGQYVPFAVSAYYPRPLGTGGVLRISFVPSRVLKAEESRRVSVSFASTKASEVKMYFGNSERDSRKQACDTSYPVARRIPLTEDLLLASLRELLRGPTLTEKRQFFFTSIPLGVVLQSMKFEAGKASVDFSKEWKSVSDPCAKAAIRSQVQRTLRQFPMVRSVVISVDGVPEN